MALGLYAKKVGMTQLFMDDGLRVPVTVLKLEDNVVVQKKTAENDGYLAIQVGADPAREKRTSSAMMGHFKKANVPPQRFVKEMRDDKASDKIAAINAGDKLGLDMLKGVKSVDIAGVSKGRGTQGVIKRHHMSGFRATHGTHEYFRHGGSIGMRATPGKVHKGKRMSGHMGDVKRTVQNLVLLEIDAEQNILLVRGAVPGGKNGYLVIRNSKKRFGHPVKLRGQGEAQEKSKNPMKASKAGGTTATKKPAAPKK